jgi:hypothetical protein
MSSIKVPNKLSQGCWGLKLGKDDVWCTIAYEMLPNVFSKLRRAKTCYGKINIRIINKLKLIDTMAAVRDGEHCDSVGYGEYGQGRGGMIRIKKTTKIIKKPQTHVRNIKSRDKSNQRIN